MLLVFMQLMWRKVFCDNIVKIIICFTYPFGILFCSVENPTIAVCLVEFATPLIGKCTSSLKCTGNFSGFAVMQTFFTQLYPK